MTRLEFYNLMKGEGFDDRFIYDAWDSFKDFQDPVGPEAFRSFVLEFIKMVSRIKSSRPS